MIDVTCQCGRVCHSEERHIGKLLRCPNCGEPVPILHAARAMVQPPTVSPATQTNQPRIRKVRRFRPIYAVSAAIGVMVLAGSWLVVHFQSRANERSAGTPSVSDSGEPAANQRQSGGSQASDGEDQSIKWEVVDAAPIPAKPKRTPSSASARVPQEGSPLELEPSLPNGARIAPDIGTDGRGELKVDNGTTEDAEIILYNVERDEKSRDQNVTAHNVLQIAGIPVGTYELKYKLGSSYYKFERSLSYTEERTRGEDGVWVNYHQIGVTLHSVVGGNARTKPISRADFLKGRTPTARPLKAQTTEQ
jgi:hypothetical protein